MSLATPADLLLRFDSNLLGQLCNDSSQKLTPAELRSSAVVQKALDYATALITSALYVAYKYKSTDVSALTGEPAALLNGICCDLAMVWLCQRRGYDYSDKYPMLGLALETIQQLRNGERVLDLPANERAGNTFNKTVSLVTQRRAGLVITNFRLFPIPGQNSAGWEW